MEFPSTVTFYDQAINKWLRSNPGQCVTQFQVSSPLSEAYGKAASISNEQMGFWQLDYGLLTEVYFLKMSSFPVEISTRLMAFLMETHVSMVHHRLGNINRRRYKAVHPSLYICITLQVLQQTALHQ
jgi:hypothetical protein